MGVVWDLIVRVAANSAQFREDIEQDKVVIDDLLMSIHDKDLTVGVNAQEADAKLDAIKLRLSEIKDTAALIRVDDAVAKAKVDEFKLKLDDIMDQAVKIRVSDAKAERKIEDLKARIDELRIDHARIPIEIKDGDAFEKLEAIRMDLDELHGKTIDVRVDEQGNIPRATKDMKEANQGASILVNTIVTLFPLLTPIIDSLAYSAGGLATSFGFAATGVVGFGVVAKSNLSAVFAAQKNIVAADKAIASATTYQQRLQATEKLAQATAGLDGEQRKAVQSLGQFETFWHGFAASFQKPVLDTFVNALGMAKTLLTDLKPTISAAGTAIAQLFHDADSALKGSQMTTFFQVMSQEVGPSLTAWGKAFGNVMLGVADLMVDFAPTMKNINGGLVKMTQNFANWAKNLGSSNGFHQFVAYAQKNGPKVLTLIGQLATLIGNLIKGMAPVGSVMLTVINGFLHFANALIKFDPLLATLIPLVIQGIAAWKLLKLAMEGVRVAMVAMTEMSPLGWILTIIGVVILLGTIIYSHWGAIEKWLHGLWERLKKFFAKWGPDLLLVFVPFIGIPLYIYQHWTQIEKWFGDMWARIKKFFAKWGPDILEALVPFLALVLYVYKHWEQIKLWFKLMWRKIVEDVIKFGVDVIKGFKTIGDDITNFFTNLASDALHWGENVVHMIANGIMSGVHWVENAVSTVASKIKSFLGFSSPTKEGPGSKADRWMPNMMRMITQGIHAGIPAVHAALNQVIVPPNVAAMMNGSVGAAGGVAAVAGHTFQFVNHGPIYGVDDLEQTVIGMLQKHAVPILTQQIKPTARAMGVSS